MSPLPSRLGPGEDFQIQDYPALAGLRLGDEDLRTLTQQGFVSREARRGHEYFKLRFRRAGKQCVKYVNVCQVSAVRVELDKLQAATRLKRKLAAATRDAQQVLHQTKRDLQPVLESHGFGFHGLAIRRHRGPKPNESLPATQPTR
jgi:hypothetical protein